MTAQGKEPLPDYGSEAKEPMLEDHYPLWLGCGYATGKDNSGKMYGLQQYSIIFGGHRTPSSSMQYYLSYCHTPLKETVDPVFPIRDGVSVIELRGEVRRYTPVRYSFFGHYFFGGASAVMAYWKMNSTSPLNAQTANSTSSIWGIDIHLGTGFFLGESLPVTSNLDIIPGCVLWFRNTFQSNFDTCMPTWYYIKIRFSVSTIIGSW